MTPMTLTIVAEVSNIMTLFYFFAVGSLALFVADIYKHPLDKEDQNRLHYNTLFTNISIVISAVVCNDDACRNHSCSG